ncbi:MAG: oxidoreductase [Myxococcaceae bacterium]|nr:oxidoreductase [Myxococcaceae bacterium]
MDLELFYEFGSQYSYLAVMLAERAAAERGLTIAYRPFLLGPIFAAQGYSQPPFKQFAIKGEYVWRDIERLCADAGLPFKKPSIFPRKSVLAARIALVGCDEGWGPEFSRGVYGLNFVADQDIEDEANLRRLLQGLLLDADAVLARALAPENRERLKAQTQRAEGLGVFGAPTFVVGKELFWGQDRMQQALTWAARARPKAAP